MNKRLLRLLIVSLSFMVDTAMAEVLQRISDDMAAPVANTSSPKQHERRITYRVVCSPEDDALPDCEKPFDDSEGDEHAGSPLPVPDLPPDPDDAIDTPEPETNAVLKQQTTPKKTRTQAKASADKSAKGKKTPSKKKPDKASTVKKATKHPAVKSKTKSR